MPTFDEMQEAMKPYREERKRNEEKYRKMREEEWKKQGLVPYTSDKSKNDFHGDGDHPSTMENSTATVLWLVVMAVGTIFKGNWVIWIVATIIWFRFVTRHKRK